jgi:dienelactone hydrolase
MKHSTDGYLRQCAVCLLAVMAAIAVTHGEARAQNTPSATLTAGQTGRIAFETITLNDAQFLKGEKAGPKATIWGDLRLPQRLRGRAPAVALVHGTVGVGPREERWAEELNSLGIATFVLDSFSGRGLAPPFESGAVPSPLTIIIDSYRALSLLATHPRIDPKRIAIMGFSRGGVAALYASLRRFQRLHGPTGLEFAAYLPFYANCAITYSDDERVTDRPIRLYHGTDDENLPIEACREYVKRLRRAGKDVQLTEYPGARHSFDNSDLPPAIAQARGLNWTRCRFVEHAAGEIVNPETNQAFGLSDPCFSRGPTVGYSQAAHAEALKAVKAFFTATFKLSP